MNTAAKEMTPAQESLPTIETPELNPLAIIQGAVQQGIGADELSKLMDLQERYEANQARKAYSAAMAQFQANCPNIVKSKTADRGKGGTYQYAPLQEVMKTIKPHLDAAGLSISFSTRTEGPIITALCTVMHRDGHSVNSEFAAPVDPNMRANETQKMGSANSYARRYALLNALNLSTGDDDDGAAAGIEYITDKQLITLMDEIEALEINLPKFCQHLRLDDLANLPASKYPRAERLIESKRKVVNK